MRKKLTRLLQTAAVGALVLALGTTGVQAREAQAIPGTFVSAIVIANPTSSVANVSVSFIKSDGTSALTNPLTLTIQPNANQTVYLPAVSGLADGRYSVVVDSDQNVVATANLTSEGPITSVSYSGISQNDVGTKFYVPQAFKGYQGFTSSIVVQNASSQPSSVTLRFKNSAGGDITSQTQTISANASYTFDQGDNGSLPNGYAGSAVVEADQSVAAIFLIAASAPQKTALSGSNGLKAGSTTAYLPSLLNFYFGYKSAVVVQNVDTAQADVEIEYFDFKTGQSYGKESASIQPSSSAIFLQFNPGSRAPKVPLGFNGAGVVRSTNGKNVIAVANLQRDETGDLASYNGFTSTSATNIVSCPTIMRNYKDKFNTSLTVQNIDPSNSATLNLSFRNSDGVQVATISNKTIQPGATFFTFNGNDIDTQLPNGFIGSTVVTSTGGKIVAVVNESGSGSGDQLFSYNCSNS